MVMSRLLFARLEGWVVLTLALLGLIGAIGFGGIVLDQARGNQRFGTLGAAALAVSEVPWTVRDILRAEDRMLVELQTYADEPPFWSYPDGASGTGVPGYWLLSRFDASTRSSIVEMVRLSDGAVQHVWRPDPDAILRDANHSTKVATVENWTKGIFRYFVPVLTEDGGLILKDSASPLFQVDACAQPVWVQDATMFHHSTESDGAGGYWVPTHIEPSQLPFVAADIRDDGIAHVAATGEILSEVSVAELLMRNGMQHLVFRPFDATTDPLHLNDVEPVLTDGPFWKTGDVFLSLRHLAMIMLYRPATDTIVWMKQGPWMAQHDVDILDDHRIAIFDNRAFYRREAGRVEGNSDIAVYDFASDDVSYPLKDAMAREGLQVLFEGVHATLPNGAHVVEDQVSGIILVLAANGDRLGQFVNRHTDGKVYQLGWGRYVDQATGDRVLGKLNKEMCNG
jgi:Arylsulfotransferase (ASST)